MAQIVPTPFTGPRLDDWLIRWVEFIKDSLDLQRELVLDWDSVTCTSWIGQGCEAITGVDPFDPYRGRFNSIQTAAKMILEDGFSTLDDLIASIFTREVPVAFAQAGDVLLVEAPEWDNTDTDTNARILMPHAVALADPPFYWAVTHEGLGKGSMYEGQGKAIRAFAVGRPI